MAEASGLLVLPKERLDHLLFGGVAVPAACAHPQRSPLMDRTPSRRAVLRAWRVAVENGAYGQSDAQYSAPSAS